ncbi:MAG: hypothetical protein F6K31_07800 [Symploca sp. SIO2G7]|nr:hypothetical protein [Symploca sp. SIO2G7]
MPHYVSHETRDKIKQFLREKSKTNRPLTVEDVLKSIRSSVGKMLKRGFGYEDIAEALLEHEIRVSVEIIEAFYAPTEKGKKKSRKKPREQVPELELSVSKEQLEKIEARFQELAKSRKGLNLQELISELKEEIDSDLEAGWSYEYIARWLKDDFGIDIAPGTVKRYHQSKEKTVESDREPDNGETPAKGKAQGGSEESSKSSTPPPKQKRRLQEPSSKEQEKLAGEFNL